MPDIKQKLIDLKNEISVTDEHLELVRDMLDSAAHSVNGATDKVHALSETIGNVALLLGRERITASQKRQQELKEIKDVMIAAINEHTGACPMRGPINEKLVPLYVFRWPLAVVITAGFLVMGGDRVYQLIAQKMNIASSQYDADK